MGVEKVFYITLDWHLQNKNVYDIIQMKEINVRHCCAPKRQNPRVAARGFLSF